MILDLLSPSHRFFSCGLYGFNDFYHYPLMLSQEWFEMKNYKE